MHECGSAVAGTCLVVVEDDMYEEKVREDGMESDLERGEVDNKVGVENLKGVGREYLSLPCTGRQAHTHTHTHTHTHSHTNTLCHV